MKFCIHIGDQKILVPPKFGRPMLITRLVISLQSEKVENRGVGDVYWPSGPTKHRKKAIDGSLDPPSLLV
jgi:hypothetical protein